MNAPMKSGIHPTAIVDPAAELAPDVQVGPYAVIGPHVKIGAGCRIGPHAVISGRTRIGAHNVIYQFVSLGEAPQDKNTGVSRPSWKSATTTRYASSARSTAARCRTRA